MSPASPVAPSSALDVVVERRHEPVADVVELTLRSADGRALPPWQPGAHIDVFAGDDVVRQYSLCGPADAATWTIAVRVLQDGLGGSLRMATLSAGDHVTVSEPRNHFELVEAASYVFVAGGIGITPILPMVRSASQRGAAWSLAYGGRSESLMPYLAELRELPGGTLDVWTDDGRGPIDVRRLLEVPSAGTAIYCCGPEPLLAAMESAVGAWPDGALHVERFTPRPVDTSDVHAFDVELVRSGVTLMVTGERSILDTMSDAGIAVPFSCGEGVCGTCETRVLAGAVDHRDSILTPAEQAANDTMMVCVSRARDGRLTLDC
ncbi:PDR/VanB family oxidoreductase [Aeromicrobium fastidiosum]|uniref:PDR/VanB family oxidoreductase n=1 Tax=Aeromicrobium fastidiosum TaxID=52699 RepID=UPI001DC4E607|nr:PDR/VanB family oxidoreductase [Aeromicrobium fastidiosum]MBP2391056.1 ferredoxin-NADP reductase [Aeromicrobium fastidiosum]